MRLHRAAALALLLFACGCAAGPVVPPPPEVPPGIRSDLEWDIAAVRAQFAAMVTPIALLEAGTPGDGRNPARFAGMRRMVSDAVARLDTLTVIAAKNRPEILPDGTTRWSKAWLDGTGTILDMRLDWRTARQAALLAVEELSRVNDEVSLGPAIAEAARSALSAQVEIEDRVTAARALMRELPQEFP